MLLIRSHAEGMSTKINPVVVNIDHPARIARWLPARRDRTTYSAPAIC
jgi:hypothetical protein